MPASSAAISAITSRQKGFRVTAVDGLLPRTSGNRANLALEQRQHRIHKAAGGGLRVAARPVIRVCDLVVDAMGWTSHSEAFADPQYDLALNVASHLAVIRALPAALPRKLIYLGSTHQYGRVAQGPVAETQPLDPVDVQGVHKAAAEHHYRIAAERHGFPVISLRFGNTFGPGQPLRGRRRRARGRHDPARVGGRDDHGLRRGALPHAPLRPRPCAHHREARRS